MKRNNINIIMAAIFIIVVGLYFCKFHFGLSDCHSKWSEFGDYFNGLLSPILAAINIYVFIRLTKVIDENDDRRQKRAEEHEKSMILMQFRKSELDYLSNLLQQSMLIKADNNRYTMVEPMMLALTYIETFLQTKLELFGLTEASPVTIKIQELYECLNEMSQLMLNNIKVEKQNVLKFLNLKNEIILSLQKITLG